MSFDDREFLNRYEVDNSLQQVNILHVYDTGKRCDEDDSGFSDSRHFDLWGFNYDSMKKIYLGVHDGIRMAEGVHVALTRVFADGAFLIRFEEPANFINTQEITFYKEGWI